MIFLLMEMGGKPCFNINNLVLFFNDWGKLMKHKKKDLSFSTHIKDHHKLKLGPRKITKQVSNETTSDEYSNKHEMSHPKEQ